jgi:hypothetical protein
MCVLTNRKNLTDTYLILNAEVNSDSDSDSDSELSAIIISYDEISNFD